MQMKYSYRSNYDVPFLLTVTPGRRSYTQSIVIIFTNQFPNQFKRVGDCAR